MATQSVKMRVNAFFGDNEIELQLPSDWEIRECLAAGHDTPALSREAMRAALLSPIESPRLSELAHKKQRVCIAFDDLSRPTPADRILPLVLEELHAGGIRDEQISLLCATGTHRSLNYPELVAKVGQDVVERYPIYPHSLWDNLVDLGQTSRGTPVLVNREFMSSDLRLGIGSLTPHSYAGFSGGGKIVMPGISGIETIHHHHGHLREHSAKSRTEVSEYRLDLEEASRMAGLHFKIDVVLNNRREVIGLFAGELVAEHRAGTALAYETYRTLPLDPVDVLISSPYPCESQLARATWPIPLSLRPGGDVVLIAHSPTGQCLHHLGSPFGTDYGGPMYVPGEEYHNLETVGQCLIVAPQMSRYALRWVGWARKVIRFRTWDEALSNLTTKHGPGTRAGVYPYAALQFPAKDAQEDQPNAA
jgi:nickel-dependent lactate racemase